MSQPSPLKLIYAIFLFFGIGERPGEVFEVSLAVLTRGDVDNFTFVWIPIRSAIGS